MRTGGLPAGPRGRPAPAAGRPTPGGGGLAGGGGGRGGAGGGAGAGLRRARGAGGGRAEDYPRRLTDAIDAQNGALGGMQDVLKTARADLAAMQDDLDTDSVGEFFGNMIDPDVWTDFTKSAFGMQTEDEAAAAALKEQEAYVADLKTAYGALADAQGIAGTSTDDLTRAAQQATPAMNALGISTDDLAAAAANGTLPGLVGQIERYQAAADSADGRTDAFAGSVADLANDALSTADSAAALGAALDALLSPTLSAEQATDQWHASLRELEGTLKAGAGFKGYSEAAMANRQVTRDYVADSMTRLEALSGVSTTTEGDMARAVAETRREFIRSGIAAGVNRREIVRRANAMGLTPKMVRTVFEAAGIDKSELRARQLKATYRSLPRDVRTDIRSNGIPQTSAEVDRLVEKYQLTEKQRRALITLSDLASKPNGNVLDKLGIVERTNPRPTASV